jgi:RNA polymerase sigma factor (sigma-70 family)
MATSHMSEFLGQLRSAGLLRDGTERTDGQLLEDYISRRDEVAFAALVQRHAPMVWGVCRRVLRHTHDAEDAFQATFLVLVRRAASIVPREMVVNWLHGVAHRTALNARATAVRRTHRERPVPEVPEPAVTEPELWRDLQPLLDEELNRLADRYRVVLVLCDLEGKTRKEAAQQIGVPEGTVAGWLARARVMLAKRLTQRGIALSSGALAEVLVQNAVSAGAPSAVVSSTIRAAGLFAAGPVVARDAIPVRVAALTEGVLKAMFPRKLRTISVVLASIVLAVGAALAAFPVRADPPDPPTRATTPPAPAAPDGGVKAPVEPKPIVVEQDAVITRLAWSRDGKTVATVGLTYDAVAFTRKGDQILDGAILPSSTVKLWDAETGALKRAFAEEKYALVTGLALLPDGKTAVVTVASQPNPPKNGNLTKAEVRLMDTETGTIKDRAEIETGAWALAVSPDGTRIAVGTRQVARDKSDSTVRLWDVQKGKLVNARTGEGRAATAEEQKKIAALIRALDSDRSEIREGARKDLEDLGRTDLGRAVETALQRAVAEAPSAASRRRLEQVLAPLARARCAIRLAFSPDGKFLASGDEDGQVCLRDGVSGEPTRTLEGHSGWVTGVAFSPDGKSLVTGSLDKTVKVWDVGSGKLQKTLPEIDGPVTALAFSRDGRLVTATAGNPDDSRTRNIQVLLWNSRTWEATRVVPDQAVGVEALAFAPDGNTLALGGDNRVRLGTDTPSEGRLKTPGELKLWKPK